VGAPAVLAQQVISNTFFLSPPASGADATALLQAAVNSYSNIYLNPGTYTVKPFNHGGNSYAILLRDGVQILGPGVIKVANAAGSYDEVLWGGGPTTCNGCSFSGITIDSNISNNPISSASDIIAHPRIELSLTGSAITVNGITVQNSSAANSVLIIGQGTRTNSVLNCNFNNMGDDPSHILHDTSTIYSFNSSGSTAITSNNLQAASFGAVAAMTGIETHGPQSTVSNNTVYGYATGANITGIDTVNDGSITVSGNTFTTGAACIDLWSYPYQNHTSGYGINGAAVTGNACVIHQNSYSGAAIVGGIILDPGSTLPVANILIGGNSVVFDLETKYRPGDTSSNGIGFAESDTSTNIQIVNNIIRNAPVAGIRWTGVWSDLVISGNTITDAGTSLDSSVNGAYKKPIFLYAVTGSTNGMVSANNIVDDLATSRMTDAMTLYCGAVAPGIQLLDNTVSLTGMNTSSWGSYVQGDNNCQPMVRMATQNKPWKAYNSMAPGSTVFDKTANSWLYLRVTGTAWTMF
jgi:hypothetical protein